MLCAPARPISRKSGAGELNCKQKNTCLQALKHKMKTTNSEMQGTGVRDGSKRAVPPLDNGDRLRLATQKLNWPECGPLRAQRPTVLCAMASPERRTFEACLALKDQVGVLQRPWSRARNPRVSLVRIVDAAALLLVAPA